MPNSYKILKLFYAYQNIVSILLSKILTEDDAKSKLIFIIA